MSNQHTATDNGGVSLIVGAFALAAALGGVAGLQVINPGALTDTIQHIAVGGLEVGLLSLAAFVGLWALGSRRIPVVTTAPLLTALVALAAVHTLGGGLSSTSKSAKAPAGSMQAGLHEVVKPSRSHGSRAQFVAALPPHRSSGATKASATPHATPFATAASTSRAPRSVYVSAPAQTYSRPNSSSSSPSGEGSGTGYSGNGNSGGCGCGGNNGNGSSGASASSTSSTSSSTSSSVSSGTTTVTSGSNGSTVSTPSATVTSGPNGSTVSTPGATVTSGPNGSTVSTGSVTVSSSSSGCSSVTVNGYTVSSGNC